MPNEPTPAAQLSDCCSAEIYKDNNPEVDENTIWNCCTKCSRPCELQKAQTVPELVREFVERLNAGSTNNHEWHWKNKGKHNMQPDLSARMMADFILSQEAELTRLRGELEKVKQAACGNEDCNCCRVVYSIAHAALSPSPRATP